jgi:hypothetical protein
MVSVVALALLAPGDATAKPIAPDAFCQTYGDVAACATGTVECAFCHTSTNPAAWNTYGEDVRAQLSDTNLSNAVFLDELPDALLTIEADDSDGDGFDNIDEIMGGSLPGDDMSVLGNPECPQDVSALDYPICQFSNKHVFRKVWLDFCGCSPSWDEMQAFLGLDADQQEIVLHETLDACIDTDFWMGKDGVLWQLAHPKIRPVGSLKAGEDAGADNIELSDYYNDYNLYVWSQIDNHDARSVITADFFVVRSSNPTSYAVVDDLPDDPLCTTCVEPMQKERRNGNITTNWFLSYFVMFTAMPRTAAAQAYRAYLGYDIAKDQGLFPITLDGGYPLDEPSDYDSKGVQQEACAACHSTLDPLTYAYRNYNGLTGQGGMGRAQYAPGRLEILEPNNLLLHQTPESGYVLGQYYQDLNSWTLIASNSDAFAIASVGDYWHQMMGRDPIPDEGDEFQQLWKDLKGKHNYSVELMLHDLITTEAYGAP